MSDTLTPREQTVRTLLEWWIDVLEGWQEAGRGSDDLGLKLMSRAWNTKTYQELHRCLIALRDEQNHIYWHVSQKYQAHKRTVLVCPSCGKIENVSAKHFKRTQKGRTVTLRHKHNGEAVFFVVKAVPVVSAAVNEDIVVDGIRWLAKRFAGEPYVPKFDDKKAA